MAAGFGCLFHLLQYMVGDHFALQKYLKLIYSQGCGQHIRYLPNNILGKDLDDGNKFQYIMDRINPRILASRIVFDRRATIR